MRLSKSFFILFLSISWVSFSQESDFSDEIRIYLDQNRSLDQYEYAYDQLLKMLSSQYPKTDVNGEAWAYLENSKKEQILAMKELLTPVYARNFSKEEIKQMTLFYKSDAGQQMVDDRSKMTEEQKKELNTYYNSALGKKIIEKQPILTQEIGAVSEGWSRDLYETAVSLLKN